ncbi:MAG: GNAT family N-acetyltransferase [Patescibacteria group bacterium]
MKHIAEPARDFAMYVPPGIEYIKREPADSAAAVYGSGYLPYSGTKNLLNVFYRARSARVVVPQFILTSENRRIAKKFDGIFSTSHIKGPPPREATEFCLSYFKERHGIDAMPRERLEIVFAQVTNTTIYRSKDMVVAYVVSIEDGECGHYWYSFYDTAYARQSLGMWLMLDCIRDAQARGLRHYYLGTVYGEKALYKTNFAPLEWWDGTEWSGDVAALKERARLD